MSTNVRLLGRASIEVAGRGLREESLDAWLRREPLDEVGVGIATFVLW